MVSKSGRTLETLSNFIFFRGKLIEALGDAAEEHIFAVTDGAKGFLCKYARQKGTKFLEFPGDMGGRYSVLSSCGLAAALALGFALAGWHLASGVYYLYFLLNTGNAF